MKDPTTLKRGRLSSEGQNDGAQIAVPFLQLRGRGASSRLTITSGKG